ncbi:hypothetical protein AB5J62_24585 [Amycolatopsis sp. cg5]|uniref:hypothetical protein n=1 Tax=Amycolatopsis sp. cg5 TaxID=3238802 RepID=UPI003523D960
MNEGNTHRVLDALVVVRRGQHALVCLPEEAGHDHVAFGWPPALPGRLFVLVTPGAAKSVFDGALSEPLAPLVRETGCRTVAVALAGFGGRPDQVRRLAETLGIDVVVPGGAFASLPGAGMYDSAGWRLFRPDGLVESAGFRQPRPRWDAVLPTDPVAEGGLVAEQVPAGLVVRDIASPPAAVGDPAFVATVDPRAPQIVLGGPDQVPSPAAVAAILGRLRLPDYVLVPGSPAVSAHFWLVELAMTLGRPLTVLTGVRTGTGTFVAGRAPGEPFKPFPVVLRQPPGGGDQQVLAVADPPPGWRRAGVTGYQYGDVLADVVPSGLVLRTGAADPSSGAAAFDPAGWTLQLGTRGEPIDIRVLGAAERLLEGLDPVRRALARLRVAGDLDDHTREMLGGWSGLGSPVPPVSVTRQELPPAEPAPEQREHGEPPEQPERLEQPEQPEQPERRARPVPLPPPIVTMSASPVPTVSGAPAVPVSPASVPAASVDLPEVDEHEEPTEPEPAETTAETVVEPDPAGEDPADQVVLPPDGEASGQVLVIADRMSTTAEQTRFAEASGGAFGEALATVNAALATWPSMRQGGAAGVKSDYVAVCLFLGGGSSGAKSVNDAIRSGHDVPVAGQAACLISGIRRLPTHRRPVLRQSTAAEPVDPGALVTEPGFLTASADLSMTVPGATTDLLIWPATARRTAELTIGRTPEEVVFLAGARFKALAVRDAGDEPGDEDREGPPPPRLAVLFRELAPGETPSDDGELDDRDRAVLTKLDRVLALRRESTLQRVEDPETSERLTSGLLSLTGGAGSTGVMMAS